jgi:ADP-ribose pyrophosphatase YjhB (NUDIX family)
VNRSTVTPDLLHQLVVGSHAEAITCLAVAAVIEHNNRVLLIEAAADELDCCWEPPTDLVLPGETLTDAVHRVAAQAGIDIDHITSYLGHHDILTDNRGDIVRVSASPPPPQTPTASAASLSPPTTGPPSTTSPTPSTGRPYASSTPPSPRLAPSVRTHDAQSPQPPIAAQHRGWPPGSQGAKRRAATPKVPLTRAAIRGVGRLSEAVGLRHPGPQ